MNLLNLRADTRYIALGDSSNTAYANADLDRNLSQAYHMLLEIAFLVNGTWQVKETYATENVLAGVTKYALMTDILQITKVEIKPLTSLTQPLLAVPIDLSLITTDLAEYTPSVPQYNLRNNFIEFFFDQTFEAVTNGLKIYYQDDITELVNTTDEPNKPQFPEFTHLFLSNMAALKYCIANEMWNKARKIEDVLGISNNQSYLKTNDGLIGLIKAHYSNRAKDEPLILIPDTLNLY